MRVEAKGLCKSFGDKQVLQEVDLQVSASEIVGFAGPNGAGKTTCLRALVGITRRDAGEVSVFGLDPDRSAVEIRKNCSYLPGETSIYRNMTGERFLRFALGFYRREVAGLREQLRDVFGLPLNQKVRTYSSGMKQQLALMATLLADVDLYILDEPDRALDASTRMFLRSVLRGLKEQGKSILLSSHNLAEIESTADRLVFLMDGKNILQERVDEVRARLREQLHLRLGREIELPPGATVLGTDVDGTLRLVCDGPPTVWLARLDPTNIVSVEIGRARLEDIYRELTEQPQELTR